MPLFFTPAAISWTTTIAVAAGIISFCALASAVYIVNDYVDRESDRNHPTKRMRPLAADTVSRKLAFGISGGMLACGLGVAIALPPFFVVIAVIYVAVNLAYSFRLKHVAIVDVMIIALGFVLRVEAKHDILRCPQRRILRPARPIKHGRFFYSKAKDCARCPLKSDCLSEGRVNKAVVIGHHYPALLRARRRRQRWSEEDRRLYRVIAGARRASMARRRLGTGSTALSRWPRQSRFKDAKAWLTNAFSE